MKYNWNSDVMSLTETKKEKNYALDISAETPDKRSRLRLTSAICCGTDNAVSLTQALFMQ